MLKSLRLLCVVAFAAALGACGSETPPATSSTGTAAAPAEPAAPAAPSTPEPAVTAAPEPAAPEPAAPEPAAPEPAAPEPAAPEVAAATAEAPAVAGVDGEKVYGGLCVVCHGTGVAGAPMVGNKDDWAPRIAQGKDTLYKHALEGFTGQKGMMPPRGGNPSLKDEEVKAAVDFMVQKSS